MVLNQTRYLGVGVKKAESRQWLAAESMAKENRTTFRRPARKILIAAPWPTILLQVTLEVVLRCQGIL